ncbi:MAG TPA: phosphoesterase [Terriglobales bacterium]|nr:phosphoesterase [Terriglobales bacterium]
MRKEIVVVVGLLLLGANSIMGQEKPGKSPVNLPNGKTLAAETGRLSPLNSFPATIAVSPDGRYGAMVHAGYGTQDSRGRQSISIANLTSGDVKDFPDDRLAEESHQSYFVGLAFSGDGKHLYASLGSITDPTGTKAGDTGNAIAVYSFQQGKVAPERLIKIEPTKLASGKYVAQGVFNTERGTAIPYPAGLAVVSSDKGERLLVANNLSDSAILIDASNGQLIHQFDLSANRLIPSAYPYTVVVARDGWRAWCSLWNASEVVELNLERGEVVRRIPLAKPDAETAPGSHPTALLLSTDEKTLYVTLSNADRVAAVSTADGKPTRWFSTRVSGQAYGGTSPVAFAFSRNEKQLLVATAMLNGVAVFNLEDKAGTIDAPQSAAGFIPTDWYPTALAIHGDDLWIATAKGRSTGPNNGQNVIPAGRRKREHPYIATLLYGSLGRVNLADASRRLPELTKQVEEGNRLHADAGTFKFAVGANPIKHVIYIIKENRTYDQIFGDLQEANGDSSLTMYGRDITPNEHKLARQFGIFDNFYDSGEVSGNGHEWSTAAITSDYNEATWQITYRGQERTYDFAGSVAEEYPADRGIPNVDSPQTGYLWVNAASHGITYRDYGEFIEADFCPLKSPDATPKEGNPQPQGEACEHDAIRQGESLPARLGDPKGSASPYPWPLPLSKTTIATTKELKDHTDLAYPPFNVDYPDQLRADEFLNEFQNFVQARKDGKGEQLPNLVIMHLPNDHTGGTRAGKATPSASVADNDLALGRIVEAVSHSAYWDDTAIFVLEDDAQDGVDHVDAHRSVVLVISKYAPVAGDHPLVEHGFFTTASVVHSMEELLGLPPMNVNDGYAPLMVSAFSGAGNQAPFQVDTVNRDNGLIYKVNAAAAKGAKASARMDFTRPDAVDTKVLNAILWRERKGSVKMPAAKHTVFPAGVRDDDD